VKSAEDRLQSSMVRWFDLRYPKLRGLLFAVPNGGARTAATGRILKATGVRAGVADLVFLSLGHTLLIEVKTPSGRQQKTQKAWQQLVERAGFEYVIVRSLDAFMAVIQAHVSRWVSERIIEEGRAV